MTTEHPEPGFTWSDKVFVTREKVLTSAASTERPEVWGYTYLKEGSGGAGSGVSLYPTNHTIFMVSVYILATHTHLL